MFKMGNLYDSRQNMRTMILELGHLIRKWDESGEHCEHWTQDGEYMSCYPLKTMNEQALSMLHSQMLETLNLVIQGNLNAERGEENAK